MKYSSRKETLKHIWQVRKNVFIVIVKLFLRALFHDRSKLQRYEKVGFDIYTPKLAHSTYGSDEYKQFLKEMKSFLDHHYACNRHHPEHFELGINGMDLVDLVEMICDWDAATRRHNDGNILSSIHINQKRFGYSNELRTIFKNTARNYFSLEGLRGEDPFI